LENLGEMNRMNNHVHILTMGGTIDKDYPKLLGGYAFEYVEEAAATRILNTHPNLGITYDVTSVCKKDSLEMTNADRDLLCQAIRRILAHRPHSSSVARIVITHGTDTMIETARYVLMRISGDNTFDFAIAFTGATKPERFVDSDASFNLGAAISATSICSPGSIVICMNGNVIPVMGECTRDEKLGIFIRSST
jgi:L-asparaginase